MNNEALLLKINQMMARASGTSMGVLMQLLQDSETSEATRARVALGILDHTFKFQALAAQQATIDELQSTVDELEQLLEE